MRYIVWGTGPYCQAKANYMKKEEIVAFVEREKKVFASKTTILPEEICNFEYDYIVVMSTHILEIIPDMLELGINYQKIIPGINFRPFVGDELKYMNSKSEVRVTKEGKLEYYFQGRLQCIIANENDWQKAYKVMCREENAECVRSMSVMPVGREFGYDRGGSICRYYLEEFMEEHKECIQGNVLEIGDRNYTMKYGGEVKSYVLHFDDNATHIMHPYDFVGDLRNGEGLEENFYDCIILTQVLMFVSDIRNTADILLKSLKRGGSILVTVSGITPISRFDMDRWGHYLYFTELSLRRMFERANVTCDVIIKGNCKVACAYLQGMAAAELTTEELDYVDEDFPVVVMAKIKKEG